MKTKTHRLIFIASLMFISATAPSLFFPKYAAFGMDIFKFLDGLFLGCFLWREKGTNMRFYSK